MKLFTSFYKVFFSLDNLTFIFLVLAFPLSPFTQSGSHFLLPETYLPLGQVIQTYTAFESKVEFTLSYILTREGSEFTKRDSNGNIQYYRLQDRSLYFMEKDRSAQILVLRYPLVTGKSWRESNSVTAEVLGTGQIVTEKGITYYDCLKIMRTFPPGSMDENQPYGEVKTIQYYAPGKWLVLEHSYPEYRVQQFLEKIERKY